MGAKGHAVLLGAGATQPRIPHALALALLYHTDPYYLFGTAQMSGGLNEEGLAKLAEFRELLLESPRYHERVEVSRKVRYLPVFLQPASAGTGQWLDDDLAEEIEVDDAVPTMAEFGVRLAGDSMSPRFADGQIVWAKRAEQAENGEIVLCVLNEQGYCKKLRYDSDGVYLVSLNPAYSPIPVRGKAMSSALRGSWWGKLLCVGVPMLFLIKGGEPYVCRYQFSSKESREMQQIIRDAERRSRGQFPR